MSEGAGEVFQRETRYSRRRMRGYVLDWDARPPGLKVYRDAPVIDLPPPSRRSPAESDLLAAADLWAAIAARRSVRGFSDEPLTPAQLSQLLWAGSGVTRVGPGQLYRAAPSAGALYPIETYVVVNRVEGIPAGLYHYLVASPDDHGTVDASRGHRLEQLRVMQLGTAVADAALEQGIAARAAAVFVWTAVFGRSTWKYRQRAYRYVYLDAGHIAAHVSLAAVGLGLGSCQIAAFFDDEMDRLLGIDGDEEATLYLTVVGHPAGPGD